MLRNNMGLLINMRGVATLLAMLSLSSATLAITGAAPRARRSHCPLVLSYDAVEAGSTRYTADIVLSTDNTLRGYTVNISFDSPVSLLGNDIGEATTSNNRDFSIISKRRLKPGSPASLHIFVRHPGDVAPSIASIKLDDRVICEPEHVVYELEPGRVVARIGDSVTLLGRAGVALSLCRFQFPPTWRDVDLSAGEETPSTSEYEYYGAGLEAGECGIRLKYIREDMDGIIESTIIAQERDEEEKAATTLRVTTAGGSLPVFSIIPRRAILAPGDNLTVSCNTDHPINMCHVYLPGDQYLNFDLGAGSAQSNRQHRYHGTGLKDGHCGVILTRVDERHNGFVVCKVGMWPETTAGAWETDSMYIETKYRVYQTEPRRALARPGHRVTLLGRAGVALDICHFYYPPTNALVDLSRGAATPPTPEYEYHGAGLEHGECGITLKRVHDGMDGLVESKVKAVDRSVLENCATSLRVTTVKKDRLPVFRIRPKRANLKPGENITVTCNADRPINMCTFYLPGPRRLNFDLGRDSVETGEYRYFGTGLSNGQCGVTLTRVTERLNGFVVCKVGMWPETTIGAWETDSLHVRTSEEPIRLGAENPDEDDEDDQEEEEAPVSEIDIRTAAPATVVATTPTTGFPSRIGTRTTSTTGYPTTLRPNAKVGECGKVAAPTVPLITRGQATYRGQWPWHAALYVSTDTGSLQYMCGGSLIGPRAMVTAAHCATHGPFDRPARAATLKVFLGKYHLLQWSENGVQEMRIEDVILHPGYNRSGFRNDIAVLTFISPAEFTEFVRPVCLWDPRKTDINEVEGKDGTIAMQVAVLLSYLIVTAWGQNAPGSPCPAVFQYRLISAGQWGGHIVVPAPAPDTPLIVTVKLFVRAILPQGQSGHLGLWYDKSLVTRKIAEQSLGSVDYEVLFPIQAPLPQVDQVVVNNVIVCQGAPVAARVVTRVTLGHTLTPAVNPLTAQSSGKKQVPPSRRRPSTPSYNTPSFDERWPSTPPPYRRPSTPSSIEQRFGMDDDKEDECGYSSLARPLIVRGSAVERGEWPWLAAIFIEKAMTFICAATLVGVKHVVTAAHCIQNRNGDVTPAAELAAVLGKHNLKRWAEPMNQAREVAAVHLHPDYDFLTMTADIALLKLDIAVTVTQFVRPICLWNSDPDLTRVVDKIATVVGWGRDEFQEAVRDTPQLVRVPIVSQEECLRSRPEFRTYTNERTLCAGFRNGSGPCSGDSGGGLVLPVDRKDDGNVRWFLRGIVSLSLNDKLNMICDLREYVVYTDVAKYIPWVRRVTRYQ